MHIRRVEHRIVRLRRESTMLGMLEDVEDELGPEDPDLEDDDSEMPDHLGEEADGDEDDDGLESEEDDDEPEQDDPDFGYAEPQPDEPEDEMFEGKPGTSGFIDASPASGESDHSDVDADI